MSAVEISYDLRQPGRDYSSLYAAIKSYGTWCHPLESTWLVATGDSAVAVRDRLKAHMDINDGLLVTVLTGEWAASGLLPATVEWLHTYVSGAGRY